MIIKNPGKLPVGKQHWAVDSNIRCNYCGCVFLIEKTDSLIFKSNDGDFVNCPTCFKSLRLREKDKVDDPKSIFDLGGFLDKFFKL